MLSLLQTSRIKMSAKYVWKYYIEKSYSLSEIIFEDIEMKIYVCQNMCNQT